MGAREQWGALPSAAKWALAYFGILGASAAIGVLTGFGAGNAVFIAGALAILGSLTFIRTGGPKALAGRDRKGRPLFVMDPAKRREELRVGLGVFALGLALWAALGLAHLVK